MTKTAFVSSFPFDVPVDSVVAAASGRGIQLTENHVRVIRDKLKRLPEGAKLRTRYRTKEAAFVRSRPLTESVDDIILAAMGQNLEIDKSFVYAVRSRLRQKRRAQRTNGHAVSQPTQATKVTASALESEIQALVEKFTEELRELFSTRLRERLEKALA